MIVRFVMVRTTVPREDRQRLQQVFYDNGWPRDKTTFVFDPTDPPSGDAHLENLQRCQDAGETVVVILEPDSLPTKALRAGFPHIVMQGDAAMRVAAVQPRFEIFVPGRRLRSKPCPFVPSAPCCSQQGAFSLRRRPSAVGYGQKIRDRVFFVHCIVI